MEFDMIYNFLEWQSKLKSLKEVLFRGGGSPAVT